MTDVFDTLLTGACDIVKKATFGGGQDDSYGQPSQQFVTVVTAWPCRVSTTKGGSEYKTGKEYAMNRFMVFMRPPSQTDSGVPLQLDTHFWLKITKDTKGLAISPPIFLNLVAVNNPASLNHHLECLGEQVIP